MNVEIPIRFQYLSSQFLALGVTDIDFGISSNSYIDCRDPGIDCSSRKTVEHLPDLTQPVITYYYLGTHSAGCELNHPADLQYHLVLPPTMHILGLCNGSIHGNSEILLKAALTSATASRPDTTLSWLHVPSLLIPRNPAPLRGTMDISMGQNSSHMGATSTPSHSVDDRRAALNAILDADAIIISSATYSHQPPGFLKVLMDRIGGPFLDVGFTTKALREKEAGNPQFKDFQADPRLLKPRVLGFLMTGGSNSPDQYSMALPSMHLYFYCLHAKVVDQYIGQGFSNPGAVLLDEGVMERAKLLGRNVAGQMGKAYEEVEYLGPRSEMSCPNCYLAAIEFFGTAENNIGCITCGTMGKLAVGKDGVVRPQWEEDSVWSCLTMRGKTKHAEDILAWGAVEKPKMASVQEEKQRWVEMDIPKVALPSDEAS